MAGMFLLLAKVSYPFVFLGFIFFTYEAIAKALKGEKQSHFHFYWHDTFTGQNPSVVQVASPVKNVSTTTRFGFVYVIDDPLTEGPLMKSKMVGRAQGVYVSASQEEVGLLMTMNFAFMEGKYNGSTITILGRNTVFSKVREMPVIGGCGLFRFARGYVIAKTYSVNISTGDAVVEYDAFVKHY